MNLDTIGSTGKSAAWAGTNVIHLTRVVCHRFAASTVRFPLPRTGIGLR